MSHRDEDHTNLLGALAYNIKEKHGYTLKYSYFTNHRDLTEYGLPTSVHWTHVKVFLRNKNRLWNIQGTQEIKQNEKKGDAYLKFLGHGGKGNNPNDESLIVRFQYGLYSILIMGDATIDTYRAHEIEECSILHAAHHGAISEGSNSFEYLIKKARPSYLVISSHLISKNYHPNPYVIYRSLHQPNNLSPVTTTPKKYHVIATQDCLSSALYEFTPFREWEFIPVATFKMNDRLDRKPLTIYRTTKNIFHTGSNGTIIFTWNKETNSTITHTHQDYTSTPSIEQTVKTTRDIGKKALKRKGILKIGENITIPIDFLSTTRTLSEDRTGKIISENTINCYSFMIKQLTKFKLIYLTLPFKSSQNEDLHPVPTFTHLSNNIPSLCFKRLESVWIEFDGTERAEIITMLNNPDTINIGHYPLVKYFKFVGIQPSEVLISKTLLNMFFSRIEKEKFFEILRDQVPKKKLALE